MTITLHHLSKFFLYAAIFSVVVVMVSTFFPFIGGKYYFFRVTTEFSLMFLVLWWAFEAKPGVFEERLRKVFAEPLFIAVSAFILSVMLSTIFADNPYGAFWSNYERGEGAFQMLHYYLFFGLLLLLCTEDRDWVRVFQCSMAAAGCMILYGLLAASFVTGFIGPYDRSMSGNLFGLIFFPNSRFQGSLGNPAYVAPYLMFIIGFTILLWLSKHRTLSQNVGFGALGGFYLLFFVLSQTRGAFLGLIAAAFAFFGYLVFRDARLRKIALVGIVVLVGLGILMSTLFGGRPELDTQLVGGRLLNISFSNLSFQTRFWTWGSAWEGFLARPIFGWGLENFSTVFDQYFDIRHFVPGQNTETWFDRAHSIVFDYLAALGVIGFAAYAGMFAVLYRQFIVLRKRWSHHGSFLSSPIAQAVFFAIPVGYVVQGLGLFDVISIYQPLFLFFAFAVYASNTAATRSPLPA